MRKVIISLAAFGMLFSGYLTTRFVAGACTGGCSLLFGLPTCVYGFVMFGLILAAAVARKMKWVLGVASFGVLFSLYFSVQELSKSVFGYWLGFPNCVYGLVMYAVVATLAWLAIRKH